MAAIIGVTPDIETKSGIWSVSLETLELEVTQAFKNKKDAQNGRNKRPKNSG